MRQPQRPKYAQKWPALAKRDTGKHKFQRPGSVKKQREGQERVAPCQGHVCKYVVVVLYLQMTHTFYATGGSRTWACNTQTPPNTTPTHPHNTTQTPTPHKTHTPAHFTRHPFLFGTENITAATHSAPTETAHAHRRLKKTRRPPQISPQRGGNPALSVSLSLSLSRSVSVAVTARYYCVWR